MATKMVVCSECGSPATPGRFACTSCGALVAAVALTPRPVVTAGSGRSERRRSARRALQGEEPSDKPRDDDPVVAPSAVEPRDDAWRPVGTGIDQTYDGLVDDEEATEWSDFDRDAPVDGRSAVDSRAAPDIALEPDQLPRTPAGAYLAPSAVLPPLDESWARRPAAGAGANGHASLTAAGAALAFASPVAPPSSAAAMPDGQTAPIKDAVAAIDLAAATPRRLAAAGSMIASLGFVLPWANFPGSGLIGDYWTRWGLAGPGHWIVVGLLLAVTMASLSGLTARWSIGLVAIGVAGLLVGLLWPYLFGPLGHTIGVWVVLAGALALAAGGVLDHRRHARSDEPV